jgi:tetratricopeptide (TPR) repeat protein
LILLILFNMVLWSQDEERDALKLYQQKQYAQAVEVCLEEITAFTDESNSRKMDSYTVLCWSYLGLKDYDNVIRYGREGLNIYSYDNRIIHSMGEAYYYKGNLQSALNSFQQYTQLNPTGGGIRTAYYFLGESFLRLDQYAHADIAFSTALYHSPNVARWWVRLGYAREQYGDYDNAKLAYQRALELQPGIADAEAGLTRLERDR